MRHQRKWLGWVGVATPTRVVVAYPGESRELNVVVKGPKSHVVEVVVKGLPERVAIAIISPDKSVAPFTSTITVKVSPGAPPGSYPFELAVYDATGEELLGESP